MIEWTEKTDLFEKIQSVEMLKLALLRIQA